MSGVIPPLPQYASMAWYSVTKRKKAQGQLYLHLSTFMRNQTYNKYSAGENIPLKKSS